MDLSGLALPLSNAVSLFLLLLSRHLHMHLSHIYTGHTCPMSMLSAFHLLLYCHLLLQGTLHVQSQVPTQKRLTSTLFTLSPHISGLKGNVFCVSIMVCGPYLFDYHWESGIHIFSEMMVENSRRYRRNSLIQGKNQFYMLASSHLSGSVCGSQIFFCAHPQKAFN